MRILIRAFFRGLRLVLTPFVLAAYALGRGQPIARPAEQQAAVDAAVRELTLYHFPTCPFCLKVRRTLHRLNLDVPLADAQHDPDARHRLATEGGKVQVPALRIERPDASEDGRAALWLYESDAINRYLDLRFAGDDAPRSHEHAWSTLHGR